MDGKYWNYRNAYQANDRLPVEYNLCTIYVFLDHMKRCAKVVYSSCFAGKSSRRLEYAAPILIAYGAQMTQMDLKFMINLTAQRYILL